MPSTRGKLSGPRVARSKQEICDEAMESEGRSLGKGGVGGVRVQIEAGVALDGPTSGRVEVEGEGERRRGAAIALL